MATTYLTPGVYIEEVASGPQPIAGASTNVVAIVGSTERGPVQTAERVSSWNEFVGRFGASIGMSHTASALFGFFENGGPAAWVVRTDTATATTWEVRDAAGNALFGLAASSPGTWGNALAPAVRLDLTGGAGSLYSAPISAVGVTPGGGSQVTVASTAGLAIGDTVVLVSPAGSTAAAVVGVTPTTIEFAGATVSALSPVPTHVGLRIAPGTTSVGLMAASGFRVGDVIEITMPDGTRQATALSTVSSATRGATIGLAAGLGAAVDAVGLATRTFVARGSISGSGGTAVAVSGIVWADGFARAKEDIGVQHVAVASNGARGQRASAAAANLTFAPAAGPGPVTVETLLRASLFARSGLSFAPADLAAVGAEFGVVPDGAKLRFGDGAVTSTLLKGPGGFTQDSGTDVTTKTWTTAELVLDDTITTLLVRCPAPITVGDLLQIAAAGDPIAVTASTDAGGGLHVVRLAAAGLATAAGSRTAFEVKAVLRTTFNPVRFSLDVTDSAAGVKEQFNGLSLAASSPSYVTRERVVNGVSTLMTVTGTPAAASSVSGLPAQVVRMQDGSRSAPTPQALAAGFDVLDTVTEPAMVICPDALSAGDPMATAAVIEAMVGHCERFRRYAIVDTPNITNDTDLLGWRLETVTSNQAGVYAPHVEILNLDPNGGTRTVLVPPSGFVAGVFARTDNERGVWKAPANERVRGIVGLAKDYTDRQQDLLNPGGVNLVRAFPNRGRRIWGARNATDDVQWRYVNVRRLFNFMETSIERSTQWVVFEPNTASTWLRVRVSIEDFLDQIWRSGGLAGTTAKEAFRVRVGLGETMTEADLALGLVIIEVAAAPAFPGEFVIARFSHKRQSD